MFATGERIFPVTARAIQLNEQDLGAATVPPSSVTPLTCPQEVKVGLAADIGTLQRLPKATGNGSLARELALTGRKFGPETAVQLGFVSRVVDGSRVQVIEEAVKLAKEIAENSPVAVYSTKHIMNHARDHGVQESLTYQAAWNA